MRRRFSDNPLATLDTLFECARAQLTYLQASGGSAAVPWPAQELRRLNYIEPILRRALAGGFGQNYCSVSNRAFAKALGERLLDAALPFLFEPGARDAGRFWVGSEYHKELLEVADTVKAFVVVREGLVGRRRN